MGVRVLVGVEPYRDVQLRSAVRRRCPLRSSRRRQLRDGPVIGGSRASTAVDVRRQILGAGRVPRRRPRRRRAAPPVVLDDVDAAQERLHRQAAGVPGASAGGQHVVGAGEVVAEGHRRLYCTDEDRPGVAHPGSDLGGVRGHDLEVLRGPGVDHPQARASRSSTRTIADCSPASAVSDPLGVFRRCDLRFELGRRRRRRAAASVGDEQAGGERVVLGLADQVGGEDRGSAVSSARMAISVGPASESMPITPRSSRLAAAT